MMIGRFSHGFGRCLVLLCGMLAAVSHPLLAERLGRSFHISPLRIRVQRLSEQYPSSGCECLEDWLLDVANSRGARIVVRNPPPPPFNTPPPEAELSNAELITTICQLQGRDRPQLLRVAAQLISRGAVDLPALERLALRERTAPILATLAREALKADSSHPGWNELARRFASVPPLREPLLHWTRLAEPVMAGGRCNAASWRLVS